MVTIKVKEDSKQAKAFLELARSFPFVEFVEPAEKSPYDPAFVSKIQKGVKARESGEKGRKVDINNLWK